MNGSTERYIRKTLFGNMGALWTHLPDTYFTSVTIPVRNEEDEIETALEHLADQRDFSGRRLPWTRYEVILLANNCEDDSVERARRFHRANPRFPLVIRAMYLPRNHAHVGWARRLAMNEAFQRSSAANATGIIATTDADTRVSTYWLAALEAEFSRGADAVCGRILLDEAQCATFDSLTLSRHRVDETYRLLVSHVESLLDPLPHDPWPRHFQHFGASFAVRRDTYSRVGGVPPVNGLEDIAFFHALTAADCPVRHSVDAQVITSARRDGRSSIGLSAQLRDWADGQFAHHVESAEFVICLYRLQGLLRGFAHFSLNLTATDEIFCFTGLTEAEIQSALNRHRYFGAALHALKLRERLADRWPARLWQSPGPQVPKLRRFIERFSGALDSLEYVQPVSLANPTAGPLELVPVQK